MAKTIQDYRDEIAALKDEITELEETNESLQTQLDTISDIASGDYEECEETEEEEDTE